MVSSSSSSNSTNKENDPNISINIDEFIFPPSVCSGQKVPISLKKSSSKKNKNSFSTATIHDSSSSTSRHYNDSNNNTITNDGDHTLTNNKRKSSDENSTSSAVKEPKNSSNTRKKSLACAICRKSHLSCDGGRPCKRCARRNTQDQCVDPPKISKKKKLVSLNHVNLLPSSMMYTPQISTTTPFCPIPNICNSLQQTNITTAAAGHSTTMMHTINPPLSNNNSAHNINHSNDNFIQTNNNLLLNIIPNENGVFSVIPQNSLPLASPHPGIISQNIGQFWSEPLQQPSLTTDLLATPNIDLSPSFQTNTAVVSNPSASSINQFSSINSTAHLSPALSSSVNGNPIVATTTPLCFNSAANSLNLLSSTSNLSSSCGIIDDALSCFSYLFDPSLVDLMVDSSLKQDAALLGYEGISSSSSISTYNNNILMTDGLDIEDMAQLFLAAATESVSGKKKSCSKQCSTCPFNKIEEFFLKAAGETNEEKKLSLKDRFRELLLAKKEAGLMNPYNYAKGYHRLDHYLKVKVDTATRQDILEELSIVKDEFAKMAENMNEQDTIDIEEQFDRFLLEYDRAFHSMGLPAALWRRTGEICKANSAFSELISVPLEDLKECKKCIYEFMDSDSIEMYWHKYCEIACSVEEKAVMTSCVLTPFVDQILHEKLAKLSPSLHRSSLRLLEPVTCSFSFTIRRDKFGLPLAIIGHFLPSDTQQKSHSDKFKKLGILKDFLLSSE